MSKTTLSNNRKNALRSYYNIVVIILAAVIVIDLGIIIYRKHHKSDIEVVAGDKLQCNPNTATAEEFALIPGITDRQAEVIVSYREDYKRKYPNRIVFKSTEDLLRVKGMSKSKLSKIEKFLKLPNATK